MSTKAAYMPISEPNWRTENRELGMGTENRELGMGNVLQSRHSAMSSHSRSSFSVFYSLFASFRGMCAGAMLTALAVIVIVGELSRAAPAPRAAENEIPFVSPFFMLSGALLTDGFDGPELNTTLWSRPPWLVDNHKTIGVKIEDGHLVISGLSHPEKQSHQYAGVLSKYFRDTDVVLAAEVQARSPIKGEGRIQMTLVQQIRVIGGARGGDSDGHAAQVEQYLVCFRALFVVPEALNQRRCAPHE